MKQSTGIGLTRVIIFSTSRDMP